MRFSASLLVSPILAVALIIASESAAYANCTYGGQTYTTGQTVGPYICMPDGTWQNKG